MSDQPLLSIAVAESRKSKILRNETLTWDEFKKKCQNVYRTPEKYADYLKKTPGEQTEIKDRGGYVGAELAGGRRNKSTVVYRSLLTLDIDHGVPGAWEAFKEKTKYAVCAYSTHKHSSENPRFRINIPFEREVRVDEYEPIARRISEYVGIDYLDMTGIDLNRIMFWPTACIDGEWFYDEIDGPFLSPDEILATYTDWRDVSLWPRNEKECKGLKSNILKKQFQQNPADKHNWVGAFCQAYDTFQEVMDEFIPGVYVPSGENNRYTFAAGETTNGAIVYDEDYIYSHHSSDPICGIECNKFDMVRLHLFPDGEEVDAKTPVYKRPSYIQMEELCAKTPVVKAKYNEIKIADAVADYAGTLGEDEAPLKVEDYKWMEDMDMERKGALITNVKNIRMIMENDPRLKGKIGYNAFIGRLEATGPLPWDKRAGCRPWTDEDWSSLRCHIGEIPYNLKRTPIIDDVVGMLKDKWKFHPVKQYLSKCEWDGIPRMDTVFIDYLGAEDTEYVRQVTRKALLACVARIHKPGCKFDYATVLAGFEGVGKSTLLKKLGGEWFSDNFNFHMLTGGNGKQAVEQIQGNWIIEIGEMSGYRKAEAAMAKSFLSTQVDIFRPAYGRETVERPRQCVFFASSNEEKPLSGNNGNRRFRVINLFGGSPPKLDVFGISKDDVAQIWGEAMAAYADGEGLELSAELENEARRMQKEHEEKDEREGLIREFLEIKLPENWEDMGLYERQQFIKDMYSKELKPEGTVTRDRVCAAEIWVELLDKPKGEMEPYKVKFIYDVIRNLGGWGPSPAVKERFKLYGVQRTYVRLKEDDFTATNI